MTEQETEQIINDVTQMVDIWMGRATYDNDKEWLENVGHCIGTLCEQVGYGSQQVVGKVPKSKKTTKI